MARKPNLKLKGAIYSRYGSQIDFAEARGIDETLVSKIVKGRRKLSPEQRQQWARWLDESVEDLFGTSDA